MDAHKIVNHWLWSRPGIEVLNAGAWHEETADAWHSNRMLSEIRDRVRIDVTGWYLIGRIIDLRDREALDLIPWTVRTLFVSGLTGSNINVPSGLIAHTLELLIAAMNHNDFHYEPIAGWPTLHDGTVVFPYLDVVRQAAPQCKIEISEFGTLSETLQIYHDYLEGRMQHPELDKATA